MNFQNLTASLTKYIHPHYSAEFRQLLISELSEVMKELSVISTPIAPQSYHSIMRFLIQDPFNRTGIILAMDPYSNGATGIPFEDLNFSNVSNRNLAHNVARVYDISYESITAFNLFNLVEPYNLILLNAALTVPMPLPGQRSSSGQHFHIWHKFMRCVMTYILKNSPDCMFVLVFGKAAHLSDLTNECISDSKSTAFKIISYHPCMAPFFMSEKSNPFQEVNSLLSLYDRERIKWYKAIGGYESVELPEMRVIEDTTTFTFLNKSIKLCDLNSYQCLLGDLESMVMEQVADKKSTITDLSRVHDRSLDMFKSATVKILNNVAHSEPDTPYPNELKDAVCGFSYKYNHSHLYLLGASFRVPAIDYIFREVFGNRTVVGTFDMRINSTDRIPLSAYEIIIDILYSSRVDYQLIEMATQLVSKRVPIRNGVISVVSKDQYVSIDKSNIRQTVTGLAFIATTAVMQDNSASFHSFKLHQPRMLRALLSNGDYVLLRNLNSKPMPSHRGRCQPRMCLYLHLLKDYPAAHLQSITNPHAIVQDICSSLEPQEGVNVLPFHTAVAMEAIISPRRFNEICKVEMNDDIITSDITTEKLRIEHKINELYNIMKDAKSKVSIRNEITALSSQLGELTAANNIINHINWLLSLHRQ